MPILFHLQNKPLDNTEIQNMTEKAEDNYISLKKVTLNLVQCLNLIRPNTTQFIHFLQY